jgi:hypothetical protein
MKKQKRPPSGEGLEGASFELLWHGRERVTRGPKPAFDLGDIVAAGADIADDDGLSALTMAAVAERLGLTTMALYRYVPSKGALVDLVADSVLTRPPHGRARTSRWCDGIPGSSTSSARAPARGRTGRAGSTLGCSASRASHSLRARSSRYSCWSTGTFVRRRR